MWLLLILTVIFVRKRLIFIFGYVVSTSPKSVIFSVNTLIYILSINQSIYHDRNMKLDYVILCLSSIQIIIQ